MVGMTPIEYLLSRHMAPAKDLLHNAALSIEIVAKRIGYRSASTFSTAFRHRRAIVQDDTGGYGKDTADTDQFVCDRRERIRFSLRFPGLFEFCLDGWVAAGCKNYFCLISSLSGIGKGYGRIATESHELFFAIEPEFSAPTTRAAWSQIDEQSLGIGLLASGDRWFECANSCVREGHLGVS